MHRAYSLFEIKSIDDEQRIIEGIASTPALDRGGDEMDSKGAQFVLPMPFKWQHKASVGQVVAATVEKVGIRIRAVIPKIDEPGLLKDQVDYAWQSIKFKLTRGLSIGWRPLEATPNKSGGLKVAKWEWFETSAVDVPMNAQATISLIKSLDSESAASGTEPAVDLSKKAGVSASTRVVKARTSTPMKKTLTEQISAFEATRQSKSARMDEIMDAAAEKGETLDAAAKEEYDGLEADVKEVDEHITRLRAAEDRAKKAAKPIAGDTQLAATASRGDGIIRVKQNVDPGIRFARYAMCVAFSKGNMPHALELCKAHYPDDREIELSLKAAVGGATTGNNQGPAVQYADFMGDFVDFLRPKTILGQFGVGTIPALRRVPFNTRVGTQTAGGSGYWVGQGLPVPLTKGTFGTTTLDFHKVATIAVLTKEEIRFGVSSAEQKVRDDIAAALTVRMDIDFIDPANAGTASVKPAAVTNGVVGISASGTTADYFRVDLNNLLNNYTALNLSPGNVVLIMSETMALALSLMRNTFGSKEFPELTVRGGFVEGIPVITSEHLTSYGSPGTQMIASVIPGDIFLADDGGINIESSDQASLEMLDGSLQQDGTAGTGASLVSLWQTRMVGLLAEREITWKVRRTGSVQYISNAAYAPSAA